MFFYFAKCCFNVSLRKTRCEFGIAIMQSCSGLKNLKIKKKNVKNQGKYYSAVRMEWVNRSTKQMVAIVSLSCGLCNMNPTMPTLQRTVLKLIDTVPLDSNCEDMFLTKNINFPSAANFSKFQRKAKFS